MQTAIHSGSTAAVRNSSYPARIYLIFGRLTWMVCRLADLERQQEKFLRSLPHEEKAYIAEVFAAVDLDMSGTINMSVRAV